MITIVNKKKEPALSAGIYVGRPSPLGNPYLIGVDGTREIVIDRYRMWLERQLLDKLSPGVLVCSSAVSCRSYQESNRRETQNGEGDCMNFLFLCVSETLYEKIPVLDFGDGPLEPYRIVCLCSAQTREQARWNAWKTDKSFDADVIDMPQFWTRKLGQTSKPRGPIEEEFDEVTGAYIRTMLGWG